MNVEEAIAKIEQDYIDLEYGMVKEWVYIKKVARLGSVLEHDNLVDFAALQARLEARDE